MQLRGLRQVRQRKGMSISQLAELANMRRENLTRLEHTPSDVDPSLVRRLAIALGVSLTELVTGVSPAQTQV